MTCNKDSLMNHLYYKMCSKLQQKKREYQDTNLAILHIPLLIEITQTIFYFK